MFISVKPLRTYFAILFFTFYIFSSFFTLSKSATTYRAGIVTLNNRTVIDDYLYYISKAKSQSVEIILFPELCLLGVPENIEKDIIPCENLRKEKLYKPLQFILSCAAKDNEMYIAVTMFEKGESCKIFSHPDCLLGFYMYNTFVVYDRQGKIIQKYRKIHPFYEKIAFHPGKNDSVYFTTDFGVTFGLFICFDIFFEIPTVSLLKKYGITDFLFSTSWDDLNPMFSYQVQQAFSEYFGINLLAANNIAKKTFYDSFGSGIYSKGIPLNLNNPITRGPELVVTDVPILSKNRVYNEKMKFFTDHRIAKEGGNDFKTELEYKIIKIKPGMKQQIDLSISTMNCSVYFEVDDREYNTTEYFTFVTIRMFFVNFFKFEYCGFINCGTDKLDCRINPNAPSFNNTETTTYFKRLTLETKYLDKIQMALPLISTSNKMLFRNGQFDIKHNDLDQIHIINSTKSIVEPVLFVGNWGVLPQ